MQKYRIYELAKMYGKTNEEVMNILKKNKIEVKGNLSSVDENAKKIVEEASSKKKPSKKPVFRTVRFDKKGRPTDRVKKHNAPNAYSSYSTEEVKEEKEIKKEEIKKETNEVKKTSNEVKKTSNDGTKDNKTTKLHEKNVKSQKKEYGEHKQVNKIIDKKESGYERKHTRFDNNSNYKNGGHEKSRMNRNENSSDYRKSGNNKVKKSRKELSFTDIPAEDFVQPQQRRERNASRKKTRKDYERSRREREGGSLMARSLKQSKKKKHAQEKKPVVYPTEVKMPLSVTVKELAELFCREVSEVIKRLMMLGVMATINQNLDQDTIEILADEFGVKLLEPDVIADPTKYEPEADDPRDLVVRPPVVTIMGHVDHGKTTLLDALRSTNVASHEAGGITQAIGAYQIKYKNNKITFLDTPGHEAFTAMRSRGAQLTDIAVLIVAADDGVMPQTIEAINHAKNAKVPIMVAINKIDKPGANIDKIKEELSHHGLISEEWGGDVIMVPISAKKKIGLEDLLENILLVAEIQELKANPDREAYGIVVEAKLDKGRGPVMSVLVQNGTLHVGDGVLAGKCWGRVRAMTNEHGRKMKSAGPSMPVEILGMDSVPEGGDHFYVMDERQARLIAEARAAHAKEEEQSRKQKITLDNIFEKIKEGEMKDLNIIIKADVQGSVEALVQSLEAIKSDEVRVVIVHSAVGGINESDVVLASASDALILGFNVRPDANAKIAAEREKVDMRMYRVIYDAIDDIKAAMTGMLSPKLKEIELGEAEVRQVIHTPKVVVAGCYVSTGKLVARCQLRIVRDGIAVHEGKISSLRRFKDDVKEVKFGMECGVAIESYRDVKEGDILEAFEIEETAGTLESEE